MASSPRPSPSDLIATAPAAGDSIEAAVLEPVVRTARSVRPAAADPLAVRPGPGAAARGAVRLARHLDVATSRRSDPSRRGDDQTVPGMPATASDGVSTTATSGTSELPWGVWPTVDDDEADAQAAVLGDALASYARMLRAKRREPAPPPARGIPLVVRRGGGTAAGPRRGPGGLLRSMVPVDQPIAAPERRAAAPPRPSALPARPLPTPRRPGGR